MEEINKKVCTQCDKSLTLNNFYVDRTIITKISYRSKCKNCCKINQSNRVKNAKNETLTEKKCSECNLVKDISKFYKNFRCKDGYYKFCGECHTNKVKNTGNNQKIKRTVEYMKEYNKNRNKDLSYKIRHNLRSSIRSNIKKNKSALKKGSTIKYVGCSLEFFIKWIESNFDKNMNWENHGSYWHLDHIKPCASYDFKKEEEILACFNWSNYRPCEKIENILKSNKIDNDLITTYINLKNEFLKNNKDINIS